MTIHRSTQLAEGKHRIFPKERIYPDESKGQKKPKTFIFFPFELFEKQKEPMQDKEAESINLIKGHLKEFDRAYIPSSHGKDSVVMVHLVMRAWRELVKEGHNIRKPEVWLNHTLNVYKEEGPYWKEVNKFLDIEDVFKVFYPLKENGKYQTVWTIADKFQHLPSFRTLQRYRKKSEKTGKSNKGTPECCDILKKNSVKAHLKQLPKDKRYNLSFVGTRAQESRTRAMALFQRCRSYLIKTSWPYPIQNCTPLSFWTDGDIHEYFDRYKIPRNPTYAIHNLDRLGCKSCPAHLNWEKRLAKDPTEEGFHDLKKNFGLMVENEPERLVESVASLKRFIEKDGNTLEPEHLAKLQGLLDSYT